MKITNFVNPVNVATFDHLRCNVAYYTIGDIFSSERYMFPIPLEDLGNATLQNQERAIILMRYIRKALENNEMTKV